MNTESMTPKPEPNPDLSFLDGIVTEDVEEIGNVFRIADDKWSAYRRWDQLTKIREEFAEELGI